MEKLRVILIYARNYFNPQFLATERRLKCLDRRIKILENRYQQTYAVQRVVLLTMGEIGDEDRLIDLQHTTRFYENEIVLLSKAIHSAVQIRQSVVSQSRPHQRIAFLTASV